MWNIKKIVPMLVALLLILSAGKLCAQEGVWIEYPLDGFGNGACMYHCGDAFCIYTRASSQYVLVFDVQIADWLKADMGSVQAFNEILSEGSVAMAWSKNLLFGYSSVTSNWDTVRFEGEVLQEHNSQLYRSYGCSDSIAFFVTKQKFYVFDSRVGSWKEYEYGYPADYKSAMYYPHNDYIAFVLKTSDPYGLIKNVCYSAHTASFNHTNSGCNIISSGFTNGFCGQRDMTGSGDEYQVIGYSAFDNQFDWFSYTTAENEDAVLYSFSDIEADTFIAYTIGFRTLTKPFEVVKARFYGYSTVLGEWNSAEYDIEWESERYYGSGIMGGRYTMDYAQEHDTENRRFYFYSAEDGLFRKINTEYSVTTSGFILGGTVFGIIDAESAWGYNPLTGYGNTIALQHENNKYTNTGEDYLTFTRWSTSSEIMTMYFYNSRNNHWQSIVLPKNLDNSPIITPHLFLFDEDEENDLVIYSSFRDTIIKLTFDINVMYRLHGYLIYASTENKSLVLNAEDCSISEKNIEFNQTGMGAEAAAFIDKENKILYGFSTLSNQWTTKVIEEEPYASFIQGQIGIASTWYMGSSMGKIYAYNGFADSWVELIPKGSHVVWTLGNQTVLVVRDSYLYAFYPHDTSSVNTIDPNIVTGSYAKGSNYPNPFKDYTTIDYHVEEPTRVVMKIFNLMGQELCTLVDARKPAGKWTVTWDGKDINNQPVPPGIYYYQLKAGSTSVFSVIVRASD
jgi:hypothetical protein